MLKFTLDTNCLIDVEEDRPAAIHVKQLLAAAREGVIDVAMVASSASERQKDNSFLTHFEHFERRRRMLGFDHLPMIHSLLRWDMGFWDTGLWASQNCEERENLIYQVLFPNSPIEWPDYGAKQAVQIEDINSRVYWRWRNQILDAQAYWAHDFNERDVFVTSARDSARLRSLPTFRRHVSLSRTKR